MSEEKKKIVIKKKIKLKTPQEEKPEAKSPSAQEKTPAEKPALTRQPSQSSQQKSAPQKEPSQHREAPQKEKERSSSHPSQGTSSSSRQAPRQQQDRRDTRSRDNQQTSTGKRFTFDKNRSSSHKQDRSSSRPQGRDSQQSSQDRRGRSYGTPQQPFATGKDTENRSKSRLADQRARAIELKEREKSRDENEEIFFSKIQDPKKKIKKEYAIPESIEIGEVITVAELARKMNLKASEIIQKLMDLGVTATINDSLDSDTATLVAQEFNCQVTVRSLKNEVEIHETEDRPEDLKPRIPVVTIMGHVDHGKTKLLDAIRHSNVAEHESGGITQHIGAYKVKTPRGEITFLDTPGHEAFTAMRARGAHVTDIVVLVVSAVEGVMPQTIEALNHAKAAQVPIIVAVNKIDLPEASIDRVKQQLSEQGLLPEEWGGDTMYIPVSALKKIGIEELLEAILLQAEMMELKANPNKPGVGYVVESKMDIGRGAVATVIVKNGSIRIGDYFVVGTTMGRVRGMFDDTGAKVSVAYPSYPVEIMGFDAVPEAGDKFHVVESEDFAKEIVAKRLELKRIEETNRIKKIQMENAFQSLSMENVKELKVIIKADVQGSVEAIKHSLLKIENPEVKISILHAAVGAVLESDVMLAEVSASQEGSAAIILAFRVRADAMAKERAEQQGVTIKRFNIIYEITDYIEGLLKNMQTVEYKENVIGTAEIREVYKIKDVGKVAGCYVTQGFIRRAENVRIYREGALVWSGKILALKRFKDDVSEVQEGFECGMSFVNYENFKKGDIVECYTREEVKK
ncbi:translation initiation factor IF-2 [Thermospira aquatica]|uniref:Translation initiation factor IF-2 n=1 Tax=Thermospira aquatica TaxID=2828656 RepID=A0AAX3BDF8_9SPIR|nr:translation initiation factor IF-2 [Thermospira aquatica]URA10348.1 translation initiation factor IF-2 [Thermospira aquatica]